MAVIPNAVDADALKPSSEDSAKTRDALLKLLSDDEVGRVSTVEGAPRLVDGDEYIDLDHPELGPQRVVAHSKLAMNDIIPRSAVRDVTWTTLCARCAKR